MVLVSLAARSLAKGASVPLFVPYEAPEDVDVTQPPNAVWQRLWELSVENQRENGGAGVNIPATPEETRARWAQMLKTYTNEAYLICDADASKPVPDFNSVDPALIVGDCVVSIFTEQPEELAMSDVFVTASARRRGFGSAALELLKERVRANGWKGLRAWTTSEHGTDLKPLSGSGSIGRGGFSGFPLARGFKLEMVEQTAKVVIGEDPAAEFGLAERLAKLEEGGVTVETFSYPLEGRAEEQYVVAMNQFLRDMPRPEGSEATPFDVDELRHFAKNLQSIGMRTVISAALSGDGEWVGVSEITVRDGQNRAHQKGTWVREDFRGRSIAKALKVKNLAQAREFGLDEIHTEMADENASVRGLNESLGYQLDSVIAAWAWQVD